MRRRSFLGAANCAAISTIPLINPLLNLRLTGSVAAAFVANVGTLIEPVMNRTQVALGTRRLPLGLYSHSDQIEQWQTSVPNSLGGVGWAGRAADLIRSLNSEQADRARVRAAHAEHQVDGGGFARAVRADKAEDRAARHLEIERSEIESRSSVCAGRGSGPRDRQELGSRFS